ncbi:MAG TPA: OmpA family protein [Adhaeribacter sp.]|nr:OmpA family protein [Adhaeribacter sp.]
MKKIIVSCVVLSVAFMSGCSSTGSMSKADKKASRGEYETAIKLYQDDINKGKDVAATNFKLAEAYRKSNRIQMAEPFYKAALDAGLKKDDAMFYYAMALKANGKYDEAQSQLTTYAGVASNANFKNMANRELQNMKNFDQLTQKESFMKVAPVDAVNSASSEYAPVMWKDELVFSSSRSSKTYAGNGEGFTDLYAVKFTDPNDFSTGTVRELDKMLNDSDAHDAAATFTPDGNTVVFARGNTGSKKGALDVNLFISRYKNGVWSEPKMISVNDRRAWDSSPVFAPDGKTLYFSSNRKGGQGGNDIYKTTLDANGRFSPPQNLGPQINTPGNENFPGVGPDGTLYISSDGHGGFGMLDIYKIENGKPVNMGVPVNSSGDDFGPVFTADGTGFFASNRAGGKGGDDIYSFSKVEAKRVTFYVDGTVMTKDEKGVAKPAANQRLMLQDASGKTLQEITADASGKFSVKLDTAASYSVVADKEGFFTARQPVTTIGKTPRQADLPNQENEIRLTTALTLNKIVKDKAIEVKDINYDYAKWDIRPDAAERLDTLVQTLKDNPKITIELSAHTDSRGKDAYNLDLSQKRAQAAVDYIVSKGIEPARITAKGYGETRLRNRCKNNVKCSEEEHEKNRRTEFKVTKIAQ